MNLTNYEQNIKQSLIDSIERYVKDEGTLNAFKNNSAQTNEPQALYHIACHAFEQQLLSDANNMGLNTSKITFARFDDDIQSWKALDFHNENGIKNLNMIFVNNEELLLNSIDEKSLDTYGLINISNGLIEATMGHDTDFLYTIAPSLEKDSSLLSLNMNSNVLQKLFNQSIVNFIELTAKTDMGSNTLERQRTNENMNNSYFIGEFHENNMLKYIYVVTPIDESNNIIRKFSKTHDMYLYFKNNEVNNDLKTQPTEATFHIEDVINLNTIPNMKESLMYPLITIHKENGHYEINKETDSPFYAITERKTNYNKTMSLS